MTESVMDSGHGSQKRADSFTGGEFFSSARKSVSISYSSSSSSLGSSIDAEYLQVDENKPSNEPHKTDTIIPTPAELASKGEANEVRTDEPFPNTGEACQISSWSEQNVSEAPPAFAESDSGSPGSEAAIREKSNLLESDRIPNEIHSDSEDSDPRSPESVPTPLSTQSEPVLQSPGVQTMERLSDGGDYRIPPSVFEPTTSSPGEWSMASNESLFSIHVGNNSFSKEQFFMMYKSGELGISGELSISPRQDEPLFPSNTPSPRKNGLDTGENLGVDEAAAETMKEVLREAAANRNKVNAQPAEGNFNKSASRHSDMSGTSNASFAFQILTDDAVKKSASVKVDPEQQTPKEQPKSQSIRVCPTACASTDWFSWVPARCRFCC